jgi:transposase
LQEKLCREWSRVYARDAETSMVRNAMKEGLPRSQKARIGKQRGAKVAQIDLARRLSEAIWHMLTRNQPFAPAGATDPLAA